MKKIWLLIAISISTFIPHPFSYASFNDVPASHPLKTAIDYVQSNGIVNGYSDGSFRPEQIVNRAEFIKILMTTVLTEEELNKCLTGSTKLFSDIDRAAWFAKYVCAAKLLNIVGGYSDGTFHPTQTINFAEAAKIILKVFGYDVGAGDPWFRPFIDKLAELDAMPISLTSITDVTKQGMKELTRGELAYIIYVLKRGNTNTLQSVKKTPSSSSSKRVRKTVPTTATPTTTPTTATPVTPTPIAASPTPSNPTPAVPASPVEEYLVCPVPELSSITNICTRDCVCYGQGLSQYYTELYNDEYDTTTSGVKVSVGKYFICIEHPIQNPPAEAFSRADVKYMFRIRRCNITGASCDASLETFCKQSATGCNPNAAFDSPTGACIQ